MTTKDTYALPLTLGQAEYLGVLIGIGELAIAEHNRSGWFPSNAADASQMTRYINALKTLPTIEQPLRGLSVWLRQQGKK